MCYKSLESKTSNISRSKLIVSEQNPKGLGEPLESQVGSVGQPGMVHRCSISHSDVGNESTKSSRSKDPEVDRETVIDKCLALSLNVTCTHGCLNGNN